MCENCVKAKMLTEEVDTSREIAIGEIEQKRYSPLRFHAETFRHMDDLRGLLEDLLGELQRLRNGCDGLDLDWYAKTTVDGERWPS